MGPGGRRDGFSLVEVAIVLVIMGILVALSSPFQKRALNEARGAVTRSHLRNTLLAELTYYSQYANFTNDRSRLLRIDPSLPLGNEGTPGSIYIAISAATSAPALCLFSEAAAGEWHTMYYSSATDETSDLASPNDCTRRMLDDRLQQNDRIEHRPVAPDTVAPGVVIGR
jgi:prepilin-type N-terminal cleavage/methylation domain-containing protein